MAADGARLLALPYFDPERRLEAIAPAGSSIAEIVALAIPGATEDQRALARVTIGDSVIPIDAWGKVRPKPGVVVVVRILPGNNNVLRAALTVAVGVAALALGQWYVGPALATAFGLSGTAASAAAMLTTGTLVVAGTLLVNALVPVRKDLSAQTGATLPSYSIQGWKNAANADAPIPCVLGKIRYAPPYFALPYTESDGINNYVTAGFCFGYGKVAISNIRIGDTPIGNFIGVSYETRQGYSTDTPITIYPKQVIEDRLNIELSATRAGIYGPDRRFTAADATECAVDVTFPNGLTNFYTITVGQTTQNRQRPMAVLINIRQRLETSGTWTTVLAWGVVDMRQKAFTRTFRWTLPTRGRYEIELTRATIDWDDLDQSYLNQQIISRTWWSAMRSYRPEYPINSNDPLALAAVRVLATGQLNGMLDSFNAYVSRICLDWDIPSQTWIERETNNPASLFRYVLQQNPFAYPLPDLQIDLAGLQYWAAFCSARGLTYNRVHDYEASVLDVLSDIAAAGRARPLDFGDKWGVIIDEVKTIVVSHISPRNSWGFSAERTYVRFPDAFRVRFQDETSAFGFTEAERIIPWPAFVGSPLITENLSLPGITNPDLIWKEARRRQYELIYRRDEYIVTQDFEGLVAHIGDLVKLNHDILDRTQVATRVKTISGSIIGFDDTVTMVAGSNYAVRFRKLPTTEGVPDISLLRTVQTVPGETSAVMLTGAGDLPDVGDLAFFGLSGSESFEAIVKVIESGEDLTRRITLIDHAPQIQTLADAEIPPAWNGRNGSAASDPTIAPAVPIIGIILSGLDAGPEPPISVFIPLSIGAGGAPTQFFEIQHRLKGAGSWTTLDLTSGATNATITIYNSLDIIEVRAQAIGFGGTPLPSGFTSIVTHTVAGNDFIPLLDFSDALNSQFAPFV